MRLDPSPFTTDSPVVPRTCRAWVLDLKTESGAAQASAHLDLRDFLKRTLSRAFGAEFSSGDLDDLAQESLLRIHERLDSFEQRSRFTTWAASIAVNCAYSELRRRRHQHVSLELAVSQGAESLVQSEVTQEPEREAALRSAIETALTPRQREAVLALLGGLPLAEIAQRVSTSQGAVYKLLHDARQRLKRHMETQDGNQDSAAESCKGGVR